MILRYDYMLLTLTILSMASCVDDYTDYNPPHALDAPVLRVSATGSNQTLLTVPINQYQNTYHAYVGLNAPVEFIVSVIDAPGKVNEVTVEPSVPEFGTVTLNDASVAALKGKEQGEFRFVYTPNPDLEAGDDRPLNLVVTVSDSQADKDAQASVLTISTIIGSPCFSEQLQSGNYLVTQASGNIDGGTAYTLPAMEDSLSSRIVVSIEEERPGIYTIDEVTGGVWPAFYTGRANPKLQVDVCGNTITSREGYATAGAGTSAARTFTINGTVNNDDTIDITWSYTRDDGATPEDPAKGTYTLTLIKLGM